MHETYALTHLLYLHTGVFIKEQVEKDKIYWTALDPRGASSRHSKKSSCFLFQAPKTWKGKQLDFFECPENLHRYVTNSGCVALITDEADY